MPSPQALLQPWVTVDRLGPTLSELGSKAASTATTAARIAAPIAGETLGAAGFVLTIQNSAGNAGENAPDSTWRKRSSAVADRTPRHVNTTFPGQRVDGNHTINPAHVRPAKDVILTTAAEAQTKSTYTGHAAPDLRELTKPTGTAVDLPSATDQATLAKAGKTVTPDHATHLRPSCTLKNSHRAIVDQRKFTDYSLNPEHPRGGGKARVFKATLA